MHKDVVVVLHYAAQGRTGRKTNINDGSRDVAVTTNMEILALVCIHIFRLRAINVASAASRAS